MKTVLGLCLVAIHSFSEWNKVYCLVGPNNEYEYCNE